jgi:hypothetical protein
VSDLLDAHGITYRRAGVPPGDRQAFRLDSVRTAERAFQNVRMQEVFGAWAPASDDAAGEGALIVPVEQPLGRLVVMLLEPRSDDGLVAWGVLADALAEGRVPIERIPAP